MYISVAMQMRGWVKNSVGICLASSASLILFSVLFILAGGKWYHMFIELRCQHHPRRQKHGNVLHLIKPMADVLSRKQSLNNFSFQYALFPDAYLEPYETCLSVFIFIQDKRDSISMVWYVLQCQTCFIPNQFQYCALKELVTIEAEAVIVDVLQYRGS